MAPKLSPNPLSWRMKQAMAKKDKKMSLVAQRLSMLQDDAQKHDSITPDSEQIPLQLKSEIPNGKRENSKNISAVSQQKIGGSANPVKELDDDESPCDSNDRPLPSGWSANRKKYGSHKRAMVVSDDESGDDRPIQCRPVMKERKTKQKGDTASDNPRNLKMDSEFVEPPDNVTEVKISSAMERATKVQANLSAAYPSLIKLMLPSHVSGGFWLGLPIKFCEAHLPKESCIVVLVDENGREFKTNYLVHKAGLSGGWKAFSIHHELQKGDVLVFYLFQPTTFKVYIVREHRLDGVDGALELPGLDTYEEQMISGDKFQRVLHTEDNPPMDSISDSSSNSDTDIIPEVLDGICFSESDTNFEAITDFETFSIIVDNLVIDSKFSNANREKYYELCRSQNSFLHQQLLKGLNCNLAVGIILETINIADAIKACTSSTSIEDLQTWKATLNGFEHFGMKVDFLCARLDQLLGIALELDGAEKCSVERSRASKRMRDLENKLMELKGVMEKIDSEIENEMTASAQKHKAMIKKISNTP